MPSLILNGRGTDARLESHHVVICRHDGDSPPPPRHVPLHDVDRVLVVGQPHVSMPALCEFLKRGVPVAFLSPHGRWLGSLVPDNNLNAARRLAQYDKSRHGALALRVTRALIAAKLQNSRRVLQRLAANRSASEEPEHAACLQELGRIAQTVEREQDLDALRGYEGLAGALYFGRLKHYFPPEMPFPERSRRPPRDPANALLSWTYTIVLGELDGLVRAHGLDAGLGFLHQLSYGRPNLSLDLLEPFRPALCDLLVLNLVNHHVLAADNFECDPENGGYLLKPDARKKFFVAYETAMTRRFSLKKDAPHTDFRKELEAAVLTVIRAIEAADDVEIRFFQLP